MLQDAGNTEVANLDGPVLVHEDVLGLQVAMQNFSVVDMLDCERHLHEPVENLIFAVAHFAYLLLVGDLCVEVASVRVIHHNA